MFAPNIRRLCKGLRTGARHYFRRHDRSNLTLQEMTEALNRDYDIRVRHQPEDRKALDLDVPLSLKQRADEMIE